MTFDNKNKKNNAEEALNSQNDQQIENQIREMTDDIEIPESLNPENIERLIGEKAGKKRFSWKPSYTVAAAACCVVVIGALVFGGVSGNITDRENKTVTTASEDKQSEAESAAGTIASAKNYDEVYQYIEAERKNQDVGLTASGNESAKLESNSSSSETDTASATDTYSDTNIREDGVDEGDIVKTDGKNLYILNGQKVQIVSIKNKEMKQLSTIRLEDDQYVSEIYVKDGSLILVYTKTEYGDKNAEYGGTYRQYTVAETYDVSNPDKPVSKGKITQSGNFNTMRVSGDYVYLLSSFYAEMGTERANVSSYIPQIQGESINSKDILLPQYVRGDQYTVVTSFSIKNPEERVDSKAIFGSTGLVYVSGENIYVCEAYYNSADSDVTQTCIRKIAYKDGKLEAVGQTRVDGTLNDSFSIDEYEGNLRLVTTVSYTGNESAFPIVTFDKIVSSENTNKKDTNSLYILDEKLKEQGKIEGLAEDERVYSARFMGDTGYFVTYKQVDPLFSVDLSKPDHPEITGKLKIPGFSDYLHPFGDGLLLGVGMDVDATGTTTQGVKLSMFDISNPDNVSEIKKYILENFYSTDISYNYKAALISTSRNLIGFSAYGQGQTYYIFSFDKDKGFESIFQRELNGNADVRGVYAGDNFYLIAGNTVESFDLETFDKIDDIVL
jgi:inhibitor of cysteine peptidase